MTEDLKKRLRGLEESARHLAADSSAQPGPGARHPGPGTTRVNVARRVNRVVSANVGGVGSSHAASSSQKVRVRQDRSGTSEDVVTVERTAHPSGTDQESSGGEPGQRRER